MTGGKAVEAAASIAPHRQDGHGDTEVWSDQNFQIAEASVEAQLSEVTVDPEAETPKALSRYSGFRRLHKFGCCSTQP